MIQKIDHRLKIRIYSSNTSIVLTTWKCVKLGGQVVMRRAIVAAAALLFCQNLGGQLPTLPTIDAPDICNSVVITTLIYSFRSDKDRLVGNYAS